MNTETKNENKTSVESIILELGKKNPDFEITLADLEKQTGLERNELVKECRALKISGVKYKVGRKGHPSVLLGGKKAKDFQKTAPIQHKAKHATKPQEPTNDFSLNIQVGEKRVSLPIHVELVAS